MMAGPLTPTSCSPGGSAAAASSASSAALSALVVGVVLAQQAGKGLVLKAVVVGALHHDAALHQHHHPVGVGGILHLVGHQQPRLARRRALGCTGGRVGGRRVRGGSSQPASQPHSSPSAQPLSAAPQPSTHLDEVVKDVAPHMHIHSRQRVVQNVDVRVLPGDTEGGGRESGRRLVRGGGRGALRRAACIMQGGSCPQASPGATWPPHPTYLVQRALPARCAASARRSG